MGWGKKTDVVYGCKLATSGKISHRDAMHSIMNPDNNIVLQCCNVINIASMAIPL